MIRAGGARQLAADGLRDDDLAYLAWSLIRAVRPRDPAPVEGLDPARALA
jgi:hypothetical protein